MQEAFDSHLKPRMSETGDSRREALTFDEGVEELTKTGERLMKEYGRREERVYHTFEFHPATLQERAESVEDIFGVSEKQKKLIKLVINWHDLVIKVDPANPEDIASAIKRHRGAREGDQPAGVQGNEAESARALERAMRHMNKEAGRQIFSEEQINTALFAVEATYPDIKFGARFKEYPFYEEIIKQNSKTGAIIDRLEREGVDRGLLFYQPHLETPLEQGKAVPPEVLMMLLDDLGGAGMATPKEFELEGDKEFQELYVNIGKNLQRLLEGSDKKDAADREKASGAMINWLRSQPAFAAWQMLRIEKIILLLQKNGQVNKGQAQELRAAFDGFEDNVKSAFDRARSAERTFNETKEKEGSRAAFKYLAQIMNYNVEPDRA